MKEIAQHVFQDEHRLTTRQRAEQILRDVCTEHELLAVMPNGESQEYGSVVLEVDAGHGHLILDVFKPERPAAELQATEPFLCVTRFRGIYVGFQVGSLQLVEWKGAPAYKVSFPNSTYYLQRRQFYRVPTEPQDVGAVTLQRKGATAVSGVCHDISVGGMRVLVPEPRDYDLHEGEILECVDFMVRGQTITVGAEIEHVGLPLQTRGGANIIPVGVSFTAPPALVEKALMAYVQQRDREILANR